MVDLGLVGHGIVYFLTHGPELLQSVNWHQSSDHWATRNASQCNIQVFLLQSSFLCCPNVSKNSLSTGPS